MNTFSPHTRIVTLHHILARWFRCHDCCKCAPRARVADVAPQELGTVEAVVGDEVVVTLDRYPDCPVVLPVKLVRAAGHEESGQRSAVSGQQEGQSLVEWIVVLAVLGVLCVSVVWFFVELWRTP